MPNYHQGIYEVKNKDKYLGTKNPRYLSSYELAFFKFADAHSSVLEWGSEIVIVPYYNPVKQRKSRYYVDIFIKYQNKDNEIISELIEIKPSSDLKKPKAGKGRKRSSVLYEQATFNTNIAKWQAAEKYAEARGWRFRIVTEKDIFI